MAIRCPYCEHEMNLSEGIIEEKSALRECTKCGRTFSPIKSRIAPADPIADVTGPPSMFERNLDRHRYWGYLKAHENNRHE